MAERRGGMLPEALPPRRSDDAGTAIPAGAARKVLNLEVKLSDGLRSSVGPVPGMTEEDLFRELDRLFSEKLTHLHRRQLGSSMPALADLLDDDRASLSYCGEDGIVSVESSMSVLTGERCRDLARRLRGLGTDSKWDLLRRTIEDLRRSGTVKKAIIFTQWLPTYRYLRNRLYEANLKLFPVPWESDEEARAAALRDFQEHEGFCVLLATDILAEGVDIRSVNCVVNYDLPYDPRRMERRIGTVDRVQDAGTVHVVNLITPGSVDEDIGRLLLARPWAIDGAAGELSASLTEGIDELDATRSMEAVRRINEFLEGGKER